MHQPVLKSARRLLPALLAVFLSLPAVGDPETGVASWYGDPYHGKPTAGGETYDMEKLTAAHPSLPFNTWVRVVNLANDKSVDLRITDRGPYIDGRIIDISRAAARAIGLIEPGVGQVSVEVISPPASLPYGAQVLQASLITPARPRPPAPRAAQPAVVQRPPVAASVGGAFGVQAGAFRNRENAERALAAMQSRYGTARLAPHPTEPGVWRVVVGAEPTMDAAAALSQRIYRQSGERTFVVRIDPKQ